MIFLAESGATNNRRCVAKLRALKLRTFTTLRNEIRFWMVLLSAYDSAGPKPRTASTASFGQVPDALKSAAGYYDRGKATWVPG
jgi:hypothetical protein